MGLIIDSRYAELRELMQAFRSKKKIQKDEINVMRKKVEQFGMNIVE